MKTAGRKSQNPWAMPRSRVQGAESQNKPCSNRWAERVSREPTATAREDFQDGADSVKDTQAVCGFRYWASKHTPLFHTINTMVAIFLARVSRAISGRMPLATKAA